MRVDDFGIRIIGAPSRLKNQHINIVPTVKVDKLKGKALMELDTQIFLPEPKIEVFDSNVHKESLGLIYLWYNLQISCLNTVRQSIDILYLARTTELHNKVQECSAENYVILDSPALTSSPSHFVAAVNFQLSNSTTNATATTTTMGTSYRRQLQTYSISYTWLILDSPTPLQVFHSLQQQ